MSIVVIGGHSRSVGKTSVVAGLISALQQYEWTAVKITQYGHGICSANGKACHCATSDHSWAISEEKDHAGESDTSRFLLAGAQRVFWVRSQLGRLAEVMPALNSKLADSPHVIIESNSVLKYIRPDMYLSVLDPDTADFKLSAWQFLELADGVILHESDTSPAWKDVPLERAANKPAFRIHPPPYVTPEIVEFVRAKLSSPSARSATR